MSDKHEYVKTQLKAYAPIEITADMSHLTEREKTLVQKLVEAGKIAQSIFWKQSTVDGIAVRDSLAKLNTDEAKDMLAYVNVNFGPYDILNENKRFVGKGPDTRPLGGGFYPADMTKEEFETWIKNNPKDKEAFESQYTVIRREGNKLVAVPYHVAYPECEELAKKLEEAATYADNPSFKRYLTLRAKAIRTSDYLESDMAWMDMKDSNIDIVIGPIENYEDGIFNYKAAFEAVIMIKDAAATQELAMFRNNVPNFEAALPIDKKYLKAAVSDNSQVNIANVAYFGGDCQKGTKTIAASLPNDPRVRAAKGGKNNMYKNMMEAKFRTNLVPIAKIILTDDLQPYVDQKSFTSFITLHEVSHTLGRGFVYGAEKQEVRSALKEKYSAIEECKADILGMWNHKYMLDKGLLTKDEIKKAMVTYLAGLFRSIRFGSSDAHTLANLIQINYLREAGAITPTKDGKYKLDEAKFWDGVKGLSNLVLTTEATGDYAKAGEILNKYAVRSDEIKKAVESLVSVPRDINTRYAF